MKTTLMSLRGACKGDEANLSLSRLLRAGACPELVEGALAMISLSEYQKVEQQAKMTTHSAEI